MTHLQWVIAATSDPSPVNPSKVQPGLLGLGFVVALAAAVVALYFSMRRHLGRIDVGRHQREHQPVTDAPDPKKN
jgi:hypothetical protein